MPGMRCHTDGERVMKCRWGTRTLTLRSRTSLDGSTIETVVCPDCQRAGKRIEHDNSGRVRFKGYLVG